MIKIAHRGNYCGINRDRENTASYIEEAISAGYNVAVDVWLLEKKWYLGYDMPKEEIDISFLERPQVWTHSRDLQGYVSLYNNAKVHVFWHHYDDFSITSKGVKWGASGVITQDGIMTNPDIVRRVEIRNEIINPLGVCCNDFTNF